MRDQDVVERFDIARRGCLTVVQVRHEWPLGTADVDAVFDDQLLPLRIWKRTTMPDARSPIGHIDIQRYELRTSPIGMLRRTPTNAIERVTIDGARPRAVIGPGRGLLSIWFRRANLRVGGRLREPVLDVREPVALVRDVTLQRRPDQDVEGLGRVRVYTIYGSEPVFANEDNVVIGDMFGMRRADAVPGSVPDPMPDPGPIDPVGTP